LFLQVTVGVLGTISASAAHRVGEMTRQALLTNHGDRVANAVVDVNPLGSTGLGEQSPSWARDHDYLVAEAKRLLTNEIDDIVSVTEVQVYYLDNGRIMLKVDIVLPDYFTISKAHKIAGKAKRLLEDKLGITDIDIDLELEEAFDDGID
jgi:divalent metal cation (Fe/Co/Zn/Cd) transporter